MHPSPPHLLGAQDVAFQTVTHHHHRLEFCRTQPCTFSREAVRLRVGLFDLQGVAGVDAFEKRRQVAVVHFQMLHLVEPVGQHPHSVAPGAQGLKNLQRAWDEGLLVRAVCQVMLPHLTWQARRARRTTSLQRQFKPPATQGGFVHPASPEFSPTMVVGRLVMSNPRGQIGHPQGRQVKVLEPLFQGQPRIGFEVPQRVVQVKKQRS